MKEKNYSPIKNNKKTIAVLIGSLSSAYHESIMRGVEDYAKEVDYNVVCFSGGPLKDEHPISQSRYKVFDLVDPSLYDGVIIPTSSHFRFVNKEEASAFLKRFKGKPVANINSVFDVDVNILIDYSEGIRSIMKHLIEKQNIRKIALFRGPSNHQTSNIREENYREVLEEYGIEYDENIVVRGDLRKEVAANFLDELYDVRKADVEAIICLNNISKVILREAERKGIKIPDDVEIIGAVGAIENTYSDTRITTILEPHYELGKRSLMALKDIIDGKEVQNVINVPTVVKFRESIQVIENQLNENLDKKNAFDKNDVGYFLSNIKSRLDKLYINVTSKEETEKISMRLENMSILLYEAIFEAKYKPFLKEVDLFLNSAYKVKSIPIRLLIISEFIKICEELVDSSLDANELYHFISELNDIKDGYESSAISYRIFEMDLFIYNFKEMVNSLNTSFNLEESLNHAHKLIDFNEFHLSTYNEQYKTAQNIISLRDGKLTELSKEEMKYEAKDLFPSPIAPFNDRFSIIIFPISYRNDFLGFWITDLGDKQGRLYESIQAIISSTLRNELQKRALISAEKRFNDIAHCTSDWLFETDLDNKILYSSSNCFDMIGVQSSELLGVPLTNFLINNSEIIRLLNENKPVSGQECWTKNYIGENVCLKMFATPILDDGSFLGYRGTFENITLDKNHEQRIKMLAYTDGLTGLYNRTKFNDDLYEKISDCKNHQDGFFLVFFDLDKFKLINDTLGHDAGDFVLINVANIVSEVIRNKGFLYRLGGDEFTIILNCSLSLNEVKKIAENIRYQISKPMIFMDKQIEITSSIGLAKFPENGENYETLVKNADLAMYTSKENGKNKFTFYNESIGLNNDLDNILRHVNNNNFEIDIVPRVDLSTNTIIGYEVNNYIANYNEKLNLSGHFINFADLDINELINKTNKKDYTNEFKTIKFDDTILSINLSLASLKNERNYNKLYDSISLIGLNNSNLEITIEDFISSDNMTEISNQIIVLKENGFRVALNGNSIDINSLFNLSTFDFDSLKVDSHSLFNIANNKKGKIIIDSFKNLINDLGVEIVIKDINDNDDLELVRKLGFTNVSGNCFK